MEEKEELSNRQSPAGQSLRMTDLSVRALFLIVLAIPWPAVPSAIKVRSAAAGQGWPGGPCSYPYTFRPREHGHRLSRHHSCLLAPLVALFSEEFENRETQKGMRGWVGRCNLTRRTMGSPSIKRTDIGRHLHTEPHFVPTLSFLDNRIHD